MDPVTASYAIAMGGYAIIQAAMQLVVKPVADRLAAGGRKRELFEQMEHKNRLDQEVLRLNKALDYRTAVATQLLGHQLRLEEAKQHFQHQLEMWQIGRFDAAV